MKHRPPSWQEKSLAEGVAAPAILGSARQPGAQWWVCGGLAALVLLVYLPVRNAGWVMDDDINVTVNPTLHAIDGLWRIWFVPTSTQQYYPLTYTSFWIESRLWGFQPCGYHVTNVLLHGANVLLLYQLLQRLQLPGAWLAAAIFAVHPVEVESVAWVAERKNVLSLAFALLSLLAFLRYAPIDPNHDDGYVRRWMWLAVSLALFATALLAKTVVVTLPAVLLVIYWWKRGRVDVAVIVPLVPCFVLAVAFGALTTWLELYNVGALGRDFSLAPVDRALVAGRAVWFDVAKLLWPQPTIFLYPRWDVDASERWQYLFLIGALTLPFALFGARHRIGRGPLAAVLIFGGVVLPTLGFINVYFHRFAFVANHFQYHASPALIALFAAAMTTVYARFSAGHRIAPALGIMLATMLLFALAISATRVAATFHDGDTLYRNSISKNPRSWIAHSSLGLVLAERGEFDDATSHLREARRLSPDNSWVEYNYAKIVLDRGERHGFQPGDFEDAVAHFEEATRLSPAWTGPYVGLGAALFRQGRFVEAKRYLDRALEIDPRNIDAWYSLGVLQSEAGQAAQAQKSFEKALAIDPSRAELYFGLGQLLVASQEWRPAAERFAQAVKLRPDYQAGWHNLAVTYANLGEIDRAVDAFREVVRIAPDSADAQANLSKAIEWQRQATQTP